MTARSRPIAASGAIVLTAATTCLAVASPALATGTSGYCPDGNGVTVVVDFQELGGGIVIRCAVGDQETGHAALTNAGFTITGTLRWGESFVCRINGQPTVDAEPCVDTPPASAYWSYWYASNGGSWTYSEKGVMNRKPPLGSFEGWSFSKDKTTAPEPGVDPVRPATATTATTKTTAARTTAATGTTQAADGGETAQQVEEGGSAETAPDADASIASADGVPSDADTQSPPGPTASAGRRSSSAGALTEATATRQVSSSIPIGTYLGVLLLLALVLATGLVRRRRLAQRRDQDG